MVFFCAKQYDNDVSDAHLDCPAYRTRLKPKIDIVLVKTPEFGDIIAAENQPLSPTDDHTASAEIAKPSTVTADGQIGPLGLLQGLLKLAHWQPVPLQMAQCLQVHWNLAKGPPQIRPQQMVPLSKNDRDSSDY